MTVVSSQATDRGTGAGWRGWGESAADGVQLVGEAAEPAMSELSILIFNHDYEANTQNLLFGCWGLVEGVVLVAQKLLLLTTVL